MISSSLQRYRSAREREVGVIPVLNEPEVDTRESDETSNINRVETIRRTEMKYLHDGIGQTNFYRSCKKDLLNEGKRHEI